MKSSHSLLPLLALLVVAFTLPPAAAEDSPPRPNIVVILCDDLGWGDIENHGHPHIKTPNLLRLAAEGIQFSDFYSASPVCSPSRVGLLTGRTPNRAGVYDWIPDADPDRPPQRSRALVEMRREEFTIPEMLKSAGYATCQSGKWHANAMFNSEKQAQPGDHGFDHWFATQNNAHPSHENPVNFVRNGEEVGPLEGYSCQLVASEAIGWMKDHVKNHPDQPFFTYIAYHEPHEPVASPPELVAKHEKAGAKNHDEAQFFANVENLDAATGRILDALDDLGVADDTLVIFTSDNGPETLDRYKRANRSYGRPGPLRGMKLWTTEAGYRVAGIMRWPAGIAADQTGQKSSVPVCSLDFLPAFAELSGAEIPGDLVLDGTSFLPALAGNPIEREKPLVWIYYNALNEAKASMRQGDWKILGKLDGGTFPNTEQVDQANVGALRAASLGNFEIHNLKDDPEESEAIDGQTPELEKRFLQRYREILEDSHVWPAVE